MGGRGGNQRRKTPQKNIEKPGKCKKKSSPKDGKRPPQKQEKLLRGRGSGTRSC